MYDLAWHETSSRHFQRVPLHATTALRRRLCELIPISSCNTHILDFRVSPHRRTTTSDHAGRTHLKLTKICNFSFVLLILREMYDARLTSTTSYNDRKNVWNGYIHSMSICLTMTMHFWGVGIVGTIIIQLTFLWGNCEWNVEQIKFLWLKFSVISATGRSHALNNFQSLMQIGENSIVQSEHILIRS